MSRSGYSDDYGDDDPLALGRYRGAVRSAIRGKRGQAFLREMRDALDAMPEKTLAASVLVGECGECCAMGSVALARGIDVSSVDPEDPDRVAAVFGINEKLAREIAYENDDTYFHKSDEARWQYMRKWVERHIIPAEQETADA